MQNQKNQDKQLYFNFTSDFVNNNKSPQEQFRDLGRRKKLSIQTVTWLDRRKKRISSIIKKLKQRGYSPVSESRIEQFNLYILSINDKLLLEFRWHDKLMEEAYNQLPYSDYE